MLAEFNLPEHPLQEYRYFVGDGLRTLVERIVPEERRTTDQIDAMSASFRNHYAKNWKAKTTMYDGIRELLSGLKERKVRCAVLSNKPHDFTRICVQELLAGFVFDPVLGVRDGGPKKPDPAGALEIIETWGLPDREILYLGDTATDMKTGKGAGLFTVGAVWGFRTAAELTQNGADVLIDDPRQLLALIDG
jgi:phosphoglycolate phosphatase